MRRQHHATGKTQLRGDGVEVIDPRRKGTAAGRALGVAHPKLINRDDSPAWVGTGQKSAPQIRPGRVAVHTQQRSRLCCDAVVEHVPGAQHPFGVDGLDQPGPGGVDAGHSAELWGNGGLGEQAVDHQTISAYEVFSPDPMPSNRIRSAARS